MAKVLLMIGTEKGAFLVSSGQDRQQWQIEGPIMPGWKVGEVILDRRNMRLFAAVGSFVYGAAIHVSDDLGKTWRQIEKGPVYARPGDDGRKLTRIWTIQPGSDAQSGRVYAGTADAAIFASDDHGESWRELPGLSNHRTRSEWIGGLGGLCCHTIRVHPDNPARIWVAISAVGVFRSDDGGDTWQVKNDGLIKATEAKTYKDIGSCVHRLVLDPSNPDRLFQQNHRGVYRSDDSGDHWEKIENGLPSGFGFPMVMNPNQPDMLFIIPLQSDEFRFPVNGKLRVYRTGDGGRNWEALEKGLPDCFYSGVLRQAMACDGLDDLGVYLGTTGGQIFFSRDAGESWSGLPFQLPRISSVSATVLE